MTGVTGDSTEECALEIVRDYVNRLADGDVSYATMPVYRYENQLPIFALVHFTGYPPALWLVNESASLATEKWFKNNRVTEYRKGGPTLFDSEEDDPASSKSLADGDYRLEELEWVRIIENNIKNLISEHPELSVFAVDQYLIQIYGETLGSARGKHLRKAWKNLAEAELVASPLPGTRLERQFLERI